VIGTWFYQEYFRWRLSEGRNGGTNRDVIFSALSPYLHRKRLQELDVVLRPFYQFLQQYFLYAPTYSQIILAPGHYSGFVLQKKRLFLYEISVGQSLFIDGDFTDCDPSFHVSHSWMDFVCRGSGTRLAKYLQKTVFLSIIDEFNLHPRSPPA
jgi:hypothetical protein